MNIHIVYELDDDGGWVAEVPELHVHTKGANRQEARDRALAAARFAVESYELERRPVPTVEVESASV